MQHSGAHDALPDQDPVQTQEWKQSVEQVVKHQGKERMERLLHSSIATARDSGIDIDTTTTPYLNTISPQMQGNYPGNLEMEKRLHTINRWNAMMMVTRANKYFDGIGGHISTYASVSHLWESGLNHFSVAKTVMAGRSCLLARSRISGDICKSLVRRKNNRRAS